MTDNIPVTVAGALRQYVIANVPETDVYRNTAPAGTTAPVIVIIDPTDTISTNVGDDLILLEQVQVDLYLPLHDATDLGDILHTVLHRAPIGIPGSQIHDVRVSSRRTETNDDSDITRVIYTVDVKRRITPGDNTTPLPFPVRPDLLSAHEAATVNVHGIANTAELETQTGAQAKADNAVAAAQAYTDTAVANIELPDNVETTTGAQAKADAAQAAAIAHANSVTSDALVAANSYADNKDAITLAAANEYTDTAVANIELPADVETTTGAQAKADAAQAAAITTAEAYTDSQLASIDIASFETTAGAQAKADAALTTANEYTDGSVQDVIAYVDSSFPKKVTVGAANGIASLGADGKVPNAQLPPLAITDTHSVASQAAMLALDAQVGDVAVRSDLSKSFILKASPASVLSNWQELLTPPNAVLSVDGRTGAVSLSDLYEAPGTAASAVTAHSAAVDPHGDRADAASKYVPLTDVRLSDARTPLDGSVTTAKVADGAITSAKIENGTIVDADIASNANISASKLYQSQGTSVLGRPGAAGNTTSIAATADGQVLRRAAGSVGFGTIDTAGITDGAITAAKLGQMSASAGDVLVWNGTGWAPRPSFGMPATAVQPPTSTSTPNMAGTSRTYYYRNLRAGQLSKIGFWVGSSQSTNQTIQLGLYRNSGVGSASAPGTKLVSVTVSITAAMAGTFQEVSLGGTFDLYEGDWFATYSTGTGTATPYLRSTGFSGDVARGLVRLDDTAMPATPASTLVTTISNIPYFIGTV